MRTQGSDVSRALASCLGSMITGTKGGCGLVKGGQDHWALRELELAPSSSGWGWKARGRLLVRGVQESLACGPPPQGWGSGCKTPGSPPASISFELVEPGFPGFLKQHTRNAAYCSKLFKHSGGKKKRRGGGTISLPCLALSLLLRYSNPRNIW